MVKFMTHEALASNAFNRQENMSGPYGAWADVLTNSDESLALVCDRLSSDFTSLHTKMRKPWSAIMVETYCLPSNFLLSVGYLLLCCFSDTECCVLQ